MVRRRGTGSVVQDGLKRLFDIVVSGSIMVLGSPVFLVIGLLVRIRLGSPVIYRQERPGLHGRPFTIYKFRSMLDTTDERGVLLPSIERTPPFGHRLRSLSLDELPELWNVLKGDMSLVGPRPLMMSYLPRYTAEQARRHEVRPGITGLAQISGRNALTWEQKFVLDVEYVDHHDCAWTSRSSSVPSAPCCRGRASGTARTWTCRSSSGPRLRQRAGGAP